MKSNEEKYEVTNCEKEPYFDLDDYERSNCPDCQYRFVCLEKEKRILTSKQIFNKILGGIFILGSIASLVDCIRTLVNNGNFNHAFGSGTLSGACFIISAIIIGEICPKLDEKQEKVKKLLESKK